MSTIQWLRLGPQLVKIEDGELVGFNVAGHEYIHQKGSPGWRNADTEMFPIIGPTAEANFRVETPRGIAIQDQHGLLRELAYTLSGASDQEATYEKQYRANTPVVNAKFPAKSTEAELAWPYDFRFRKTFRLDEQGLLVEFGISGEPGMPYMLGYHPAFRLIAHAPVIQIGDRHIKLDDVLAVGSRALHIPDCNSILLHDSASLRIATTGFGAFMCWTEVCNMVCIEPITCYPYDLAQSELHQGFRTLADGQDQVLSVRIEPVYLPFPTTAREFGPHG